MVLFEFAKCEHLAASSKGVGRCDEYPAAFWLNQSPRYDARLEAGMTLCVESYLGPAGAGKGVKLEDQLPATETGVEVLSRLPFEEAWL